MSSPAPHELWKQADGDAERYRQLMVEHGHVVPGEPRPLPCGYDVLGPSAQQRIDGMGDDPAWDEAIAKAGDDGYTDAAAVPDPDAGDDTLREQLAEVLATCTCTPHPYGDGPQIDCPRHGHEKHQADALLPLIREHVAAAVQAERETYRCTCPPEPDETVTGQCPVHGDMSAQAQGRRDYNHMATLRQEAADRAEKAEAERDDYAGRYEIAHESFLASERDRDLSEAGRHDEKAIANAALAAAAKEQQRAEEAEAATERVRAVIAPWSHRAARHIRAALDGTEADRGR